MSLFYDDKKIFAANWMLKYLYKNHCYKIRSPYPEHNGYRGDVIKLSNLPKKYNYELLSQAADILNSNEHIKYISRDFRRPEESQILIQEEGRQAVLSSFYIKIICKKWSKRTVWVLGVIVTLLTIHSFLSSSTASKEKPPIKTVKDSSITNTPKTN